MSQVTAGHYERDMSQRAFRRQVGQFAIVGFDGYTVPEELRMLANEFDIGGVILFSRNIDSPTQVAELTREVQSLRRDWPLWVSVDQEGGRVARLRDPFTEWPAMQVLGRSRDANLARRFASALASELTAVGITLNFAPVVDVHTNPKNPVIGDRAISAEPAIVSTLGVSIIEAFQVGGLAACAKHFPGHGDTSQDSHQELPILDINLACLDKRELVPFRAAIGADVASVMIGHVLVRSLDEDRPATLSRHVVHDLLRGKLNYGGLVVTDDMEMKAITGRYRTEEAAVEAIGATVDLLLLCGTDTARHVGVLEALIHAAEQGGLAMHELEHSLGRHRRVKEQYLTNLPVKQIKSRVETWIGRKQSKMIAEEIAHYG